MQAPLPRRFETRFCDGVHPAVGDFNGDGVPDITPHRAPKAGLSEMLE